MQALYKPAFGAVDWDLTPSFSHRYGAAAAGLGVIGWSGNLLTPQYGARVLLESVLTDAELEPDPMLKESPCDGCRTCVKVCQAGFIAVQDHEAVEIGGLRFVHNKKGHNIRCSIVCAGISGLSRYSEWATWSPGRIRLPHSDEHIREFWDHLVKDNLWKQNHTSQMIKNLALAPEDRIGVDHDCRAALAGGLEGRPVFFLPSSGACIVLKIAVVGGDGTGPEVVAEGLKVLKAVAAKERFQYETKEYDFSGKSYLARGGDPTQPTIPARETVIAEIRVATVITP